MSHYRLQEKEGTSRPVAVGCVGMATRDTLIFVDELPCSDEALVRARNIVVCLGGKGVIPALTLKRLGIPTGLLCLTSETDRDQKWNSLLKQTLGGQYIVPALEEANAAWITISIDGRTHTAIQERRCQILWMEYLETVVRRFFENFSVVYIAAEDPELLAFVYRECNQRSTEVVVNPSSALLGRLAETPQIFGGLLGRASCLIMNEAESAAALKHLGISDWSAYDSHLLRCVVVTAGSKGGWCSEAPFSEWKKFEPVRSTVDLICPVGAGDVFAGAFLRYWLVESDSAGIACQKAAALASEKIGEQLTGIALND